VRTATPPFHLRDGSPVLVHEMELPLGEAGTPTS
jgi:hypothetical protein